MVRDEPTDSPETGTLLSAHDLWRIKTLMESRDSDCRHPSQPRNRWRLRVLLALLATALLIWLLAGTSGAYTWATENWRDHRANLMALVRDYPVIGTVAIFLLHSLLAALALPGASLLMLVAGAGYGPWVGTLLCLTGCTVGASASMLAARHFLRSMVRRRLGERLANLDVRIAEDGIAYLLSLRLLPVIPFALVNVAAGVSTMKVWTFIWVSFVGMLVGTFFYVNAGSELARVEGVGDLYSPRVLLSLTALVIIPWLPKLVGMGRRRLGGART